MDSIGQTIQGFSKRLEATTPEAISAFPAACAERLSRFYELFSDREKWGDFRILRQSLDGVWRRLAGDTSSDCLPPETVSAVLAQVPDGDRFCTALGVAAQDFCWGVPPSIKRFRSK
jgi:uncharacterized protein YjaG (DUF416 family)